MSPLFITSHATPVPELSLRRELLDKRLQGPGVATHVLAGLVAVLEEDECGHGADAELLGKLGKCVDVELGEVNLALVLLRLGPPVARKG